jgi:hypothetical protein
MIDEKEASGELSNKVIIATLIQIEKDLQKLVETNMVLIHQTIQSNKLAKKGLFLQFNVKGLSLPEIDEEYVHVKEQIESNSDKVMNLSKKLMFKEN